MAYKYCLELFASNCAKHCVQDVKREDLVAFIRKLYELNCEPRTAYNRAVIVSQLLKANGLTKLLRNRDWPEYVEPIRAIYEEEEIQALLKACEEDERSLSLLPSDRASGQGNAPLDLVGHPTSVPTSYA
jgi:hypothetical protein